MSLVKKIQNTSFRHDLFKKNDKIVLAVSGGPDSCAMLNILARLEKKYSLELLVAHVNYGLRGKDSDKDEKLVRELAEKYGIGVEVLNASITPPSRRVRRDTSPGYREGGNTLSENALRDMRYDFFEKLRHKNNFDFIAVAHNSDDQVETYLLRTIRGAGLDGLTAMKFKNEKLIRPLLEISKKEILEYLKKNKLDYRTDKTNLENEYLRNKVRNRLLPYLEKNFNPNIRETIFDSTVSIVEDVDFLDKATAKQQEKLSELDVKKLLKLHPAILRRILRKKLEAVKGNLKNIDASHIEEVLKIIKSTKNKRQIVTLKGLKVMRKGDRLEISCIK